MSRFDFHMEMPERLEGVVLGGATGALSMRLVAGTDSRAPRDWQVLCVDGKGPGPLPHSKRSERPAKR
jgi:hypothetical protein